MVDGGDGGEFVDTPRALNVTLENGVGGVYRDCYVDQRYKVCPEVIIPNVTAQPNRSNVTYLRERQRVELDEPHVRVRQCNGTNASVYETWAWGWPAARTSPSTAAHADVQSALSPT